jgi:uncharacterized membrane protein
MSRFAAILATTGLFIYPAAVYLGVQYFEPRLLAVFLLVLVLLRFGNARFLGLVIAAAGPISAGAPSAQELSNRRWIRGQTILAAVFMLAVILYSVGSNQMTGLKLYPLVISVYLLLSFGYSLRVPPTVIERIARLTDPELSAAGVRYTRRVTLLWCGFFVFNSLVILYSIYAASFEFWALYNGFLSYLLIGALLGGEYLYRVLILKKNQIKN